MSILPISRRMGDVFIVRYRSAIDLRLANIQRETLIQLCSNTGNSRKSRRGTLFVRNVLLRIKARCRYDRNCETTDELEHFNRPIKQQRTGNTVYFGASSVPTNRYVREKEKVATKLVGILMYTCSERLVSTSLRSTPLHTAEGRPRQLDNECEKTARLG